MSSELSGARWVLRVGSGEVSVKDRRLRYGRLWISGMASCTAKRSDHNPQFPPGCDRLASSLWPWCWPPHHSGHWWYQNELLQLPSWQIFPYQVWPTVHVMQYKTVFIDVTGVSQSCMWNVIQFLGVIQCYSAYVWLQGRRGGKHECLCVNGI